MSEFVTLSEAPSNIDGLAPSCKLVWIVLANTEKATQQELTEKTQLSERTTRWALTQLASADLVESRPSFEDARQDYYSLPGEAVSITDR